MSKFGSFSIAYGEANQADTLENVLKYYPVQIRQIEWEGLPVGKVSHLIPHETSTPCPRVSRRGSVQYLIEWL